MVEDGLAVVIGFLVYAVVALVGIGITAIVTAYGAGPTKRRRKVRLPEQDAELGKQKRERASTVLVSLGTGLALGALYAASRVSERGDWRTGVYTAAIAAGVGAGLYATLPGGLADMVSGSVAFASGVRFTLAAALVAAVTVSGVVMARRALQGMYNAERRAGRREPSVAKGAGERSVFDYNRRRFTNRMEGIDDVAPGEPLA